MKTDKSKHKFLLGLHEWFKNQEKNVYPLVQYQKSG